MSSVFLDVKDALYKHNQWTIYGHAYNPSKWSKLS